MIEGNVVSNLAALAGTAYFTDQQNHDISVVATQSITGVGFQPTGIIINAVVGSPAQGQASWGFTHDGGSGGRNIQDKDRENPNTYTHNNTQIIVMVTGASTAGFASILSYDVDGFTLNWTKVNSPTGNCEFKYFCFK